MARSSAAPVASPAGPGPEVEAYLRALDGPMGAQAFVTLLGIRLLDASGLHTKVQRGLAFSAFERLARAMGLSQQAAAALLAIPARTLQRRKAEKRLHPDESDRLARLARVFGQALQLFEGDAAAARRWLDAPQRAFGGTAPLQMAKTDVGAREVETLLGQLEHGIPG